MKIFKFLVFEIYLLGACVNSYAQRISELEQKFPMDRRLAAEINDSTLSQLEKEVVYFINLARLSPSIFADTYLEYFIKEYRLDKENPYIKSLWKTLKLARPVSPLLSDVKMSLASKCRAKELKGQITLPFEKKISSNVQEEGIIPRRSSSQAQSQNTTKTPTGCSLELDYYAECYAIQKKTSLEIVFQLLIDFDNKTYSNRQICLSNEFSKVGICICPHEDYNTLAVLDFK
ncbi:MAG: hypothetical protein NZM38_01270 [Cytophagales bacterium]|nr:hypothetical protein [Cytophagales bacterium]MDW8383380.1 hypothetical protein [Flammeovirgaceae bacterium]